MKKERVCALLLVVSIALFGFSYSSSAFEVQLGCKPLTINGFVQQTVNYGLIKNELTNESGLNSFVTLALLEFAYQPTEQWKFFVSGSFNGDWAYPILANQRQWEQKGFDESRDKKYILDDWQDILKEAHVTFASEHFYLRVGKQIVQWGESDGLLLTNILNPLDTRRGMSDVKFENSIIPIWMVRAEYSPRIVTSWINDINFQVVVDPNFKFRMNEVLGTGNDVYGTWGADIGPAVLGAPGVYLGSARLNLEKPEDWETRNWGYGARLKANILDTNVSLLAYHGRDRDYVSQNTGVPDITIAAFKNTPVLHLHQDGYFPYFKFVGATLARDLSWLKSYALGGVSPVIRVEALYAFNSTYGTSDNGFWKTDEFRSMIGADWKIKVPWLNPNAFFTISPQYFFQHFNDYPRGGVTLSQRYSVPTGTDTNLHKTTIMVTTSYLKNKLSPLFFWLRDINGRSDQFVGKISYEPDEKWIYTLGGVFVDGRTNAWGVEPQANKDMIFGTIGYRF